MADVFVEFGSNAGPAAREAQQFTTAVRGAVGAQDEAARSTKGMNQAHHETVDAHKTLAPHVERHKEGLRHTIQLTGVAGATIGGFGTELQHVARHLAHVAEAGVSPMLIGFTALTAAVILSKTIMESHSEALEEEHKRLEENAKSAAALTNALEEVDKARQGSALADAEKKEGSIRRIGFAAGEGGIAMAKDLEGKGYGDAYQATAEAASSDTGMMKRRLDAAETISRITGMPLAEAVKKVDPDRLRNSKGDQVVREIIGESYGETEYKGNIDSGLFQANTVDAVRAANERQEARGRDFTEADKTADADTSAGVRRRSAAPRIARIQALRDALKPAQDNYNNALKEASKGMSLWEGARLLVNGTKPKSQRALDEASELLFKAAEALQEHVNTPDDGGSAEGGER